MNTTFELNVNPLELIAPLIALVGIGVGIYWFRSAKGSSDRVGTLIAPIIMGLIVGAVVRLVTIGGYYENVAKQEASQAHAASQLTKQEALVASQEYMMSLPEQWQNLASIQNVTQIECDVLWREFKKSKPPQITVAQYNRVEQLLIPYKKGISIYVKSGE